MKEICLEVDSTANYQELEEDTWHNKTRERERMSFALMMKMDKSENTNDKQICSKKSIYVHQEILTK